MLSIQQHNQVIALIIKAGQAALKIRDSGELNPKNKTTKSYSTVTDADIASSKILTKALSDLFPHLEIISEEDNMHSDSGKYENAIIIDPIDGTQRFSAGERNFCVLIGFVKNQNPVHGFAYYPDSRISKIYFTSPLNGQSYTQNVTIFNDGLFSLNEARILSSRDTESELRLFEPYDDIGEILSKIEYSVIRPKNLSGNIAMITGQVEMTIGPRTKKDWDVAAFDAIARGMGAIFINLENGKPMTYGEVREKNRAFMVPAHIGGNINLLNRLGLYNVLNEHYNHRLHVETKK